MLHIVALPAEEGAEKPYTSARLNTRYKGDFKYGRFEMRAKLPSGQGSWPAFWMLPTDYVYGGWPKSGEIDIMEAVNLKVADEEGNVESNIHGTLHYGRDWPNNVNSGKAYEFPADTFLKALAKKNFGTPEFVCQNERFLPTRAWNDTSDKTCGKAQRLLYPRNLIRRPIPKNPTQAHKDYKTQVQRAQTSAGVSPTRVRETNSHVMQYARTKETVPENQQTIYSHLRFRPQTCDPKLLNPSAINNENNIFPVEPINKVPKGGENFVSPLTREEKIYYRRSPETYRKIKIRETNGKKVNKQPVPAVSIQTLDQAIKRKSA